MTVYRMKACHADWLTMVTMHTEDELDLYIQLGNGGLLKYLEEQLIF